VQTIPTTAGLSGDAKTSLALSLEGRWVAFGDGRDVRIWHVPTAALVARIQGVGKVNAFSPNGRFLLTGDAAMWSMNSAAQVNARLSEQETAQAPVIAQRKAVLAHGSRIGPILLWDLELGDVVKRLDEQVWSRVVAIDPSARVLVAMNGTTLGSMQSARIWDIESQKKRGELSPGGSIELGAVSNDARLVALLVEGRGALVFDAQTLKELGSFGAPSTVDAMSFNAEGNRLILRAKGTDTPLDIGSLARPQPAAQRGGSPRDTAPWALSITGDTEAQSLAVRNTKTGAPVQTLATGVVEYALSGDGRRLVTLGRSGQFASMWVYPDDLVADGCARAGRELSDADRKTYLGGKAGIDPCRNSR
jgi:WD40 repeat protein